VAAWFLGLWVRILPGTWMSVSCECCLLSGSGLCCGQVTPPEASYRVWCVWVRSWNLHNEKAPDSLVALASWKKKHSLHVARLANVIKSVVPRKIIFAKIYTSINTGCFKKFWRISNAAISENNLWITKLQAHAVEDTRQVFIPSVVSYKLHITGCLKIPECFQVLVSLNKLRITKLQTHTIGDTRHAFIPSVASYKLKITWCFKNTWPISSVCISEYFTNNRNANTYHWRHTSTFYSKCWKLQIISYNYSMCALLVTRRTPSLCSYSCQILRNISASTNAMV
jgi:hypothetical protein